MRSGTDVGGARRPEVSGRPAALLVLVLAVLCVLIGSAGAASANAGPVTAGGAAAAHVRPALVRPMTGTGCHTYNYWNGAHVCITVVGSGLNVQSVSGETDGPDTDWGKLWDTAGVITIWGHPTNHYLTVSWASGGGVWLANGDNFCFTDTTLNQTACLTIRS